MYPGNHQHEKARIIAAVVNWANDKEYIVVRYQFTPLGVSVEPGCACLCLTKRERVLLGQRSCGLKGITLDTMTNC